MTSLSLWQQLYSAVSASTLEPLVHPLLTEQGITLYCKRDDLLHPRLSGNKWRKLKYPLRQALTEHAAGILSFGGAYSNHLHALAAAGQALNLPTVGIVRGEANSHNPTLTDVRHWGMKIEFVNRQQYRRRQDSDWLAELAHRYSGYMLLPEGGSCLLALPGVAELWQELPPHVEVVLPVASGGTIAGLLSARPVGAKVRGYAVLKGDPWLAQEIVNLYPAAAQDKHWQLIYEHHGGGYAKCRSGDKQAIAQLATELQLPLEPIYSGKALLGLFKDIAAGQFQRDSTLVFLHTGGLQGARSPSG